MVEVAARVQAEADRREAEDGIARPLLEVLDIADLIVEVDNAPAPRWLFRPVVAEGDHGVIAATHKAGKTYMVTDAAVSVSSGTPWLGIFPVDAEGPVLLFVGEGGKRKVVRRLRAIACAKGVELATLPIRVCMRVPHLTSEGAMLLVEEEVALHRPALIIIDPLYLAARGAQGSDLYEMGAHLERVQAVAQGCGAALLIAHHWNKTGDGKGADRMSGVGPAAWGRVLISASVVNRRTDDVTNGSAVVLDIEFQGDEIAEQKIRIRRRVWADDPEDLTSALHYEVERLEVEAIDEPLLEGLTPSARRVLRVLEDAPVYLTVREIGDALAVDKTGSPPLKARTIQEACNSLKEVDLAESESIMGGSALRWRTPGRQGRIGDGVDDDPFAS